MNTIGINKSITRLQQALMEYDRELIHMPGAIKNIVDAQSSNPILEDKIKTAKEKEEKND